MRLIDADEFCRYTDEHCQDGFADLWKELIRRQPTAFDKERVIEKLYRHTAEECELHECGIRSEYCNVCMAKKAIEIVERGGIE